MNISTLKHFTPTYCPPTAFASISTATSASGSITMSSQLYDADTARHRLPKRPRTFAPLNPDKVNIRNAHARRLEGIVFDVDGTLW